MSLLKRCLQAYEAPTEDKAAVKAKLIAAEERREQILADKHRYQRSFFTLEKVNSDTPVDLYGQAVPSVSYNRLSIFDHEGNPLLAVRFSEQALCNLMFGANRSDRTPLTCESVEGRALAPFRRDAAQYDVDQGLQRIIEEMGGVGKLSGDQLEALISKKGPLSKAASESIQSCLKNCYGYATGHSSQRFLLERHLNNLTAVRNDIQIEAVNALTQQGKKQAYLPAPGVDVECARDDSRMIRVMTPLQAIERTVLQKALLQNLKRTLDQYGIQYEPELFLDTSKLRRFRDQVKDWGRQFSFSDSNRAEAVAALEAYEGLINEYFNPYIAEKDELSVPQHLVCTTSLHQSHGFMTHSEYEVDEQSVLELKISTGYIEDFYGNAQLREIDQIIQIEIVREEFVNALRGSVGDERFRCSMNYYAGVYLPWDHPQERPDPLKALLDEHADDNDALVAELMECIKVVNTLLEAGVTRKEHKQTLVDQLERVDGLMDQIVERRQTEVIRAGRVMSDKMKADIQTSLSRSMHHLELSDVEKDRIKRLIQMDIGGE